MQIHMINAEKYGFLLSEFATVMSVKSNINADVVGSSPTGTTSGDW